MQPLAIATETEFFVSPESYTRATYLPLDHDPALVQVRQDFYALAESQLNANHQLLMAGHFDAVLLPVDALGTGRRVVEARDQPQLQAELRRGLRLDCLRLYSEAYRRLTYEYFDELKQTFDPETGQYFSHGQIVTDITANGLSPLAEKEEAKYRLNDHVDAHTLAHIGRTGLFATIDAPPRKVRKIMPCADWAIERYRQGKTGYGGYIPEKEKRIFQDTRFDPKTRDLYTEQVHVSGEIISDEDVAQTLSLYDVDIYGMQKTDVHALQLWVDDDLFDFIAMLDTVTGERTGLRLFMGEVVDENFVRDYTVVRAQAKLRQQSLQSAANELATYIEELAVKQTDGWLAEGLVENFVKDRLLAIAYEKPDTAEVIFDKSTADGLAMVRALADQGRIDEAMNQMEVIKELAPAPGYCGAGSCGLEGVNPNSEVAKALEKLGIDSKNALSFKDGKCGNCGKKGVYFDRKGKNTACINCTTAKVL